MWKRVLVSFSVAFLALQTTASHKSKAPEIVLPPKGDTVVKGHDVELRCKATGTPTPKVRWIKNNDRLKLQPCDEGDRVCIGEDGTLVIQNVGVVEDSGEYRCIVKNSAGKVRSGAAKINVHHKEQMPPLFLNNIQDQTAKVGETVTLICKAGGSENIHMSWSRDYGEKQLPEDRSFQLDDNSLRIVDLKPSDAGYYTCTAENEFGWMSQMMYLSVAARMSHPLPTPKPPLPNPVVSFDPLPTDQDVLIGETAYFDCNVIGPHLTTQLWVIGEIKQVDNGPPVVEDKPNGVIGGRAQGNVSMQLEDSRFSVFPNGTLAIYDVKVQDEGVYICRAVKSGGNRTDATATLTVIELGTTPSPVEPSPTATATGTEGPIDGVPNKVPTQVEVVALSSTEVKVSWKYPDRFSTRRPTQYIISYALVAESPQGPRTLTVDGRSTMTHIIVGLKPYRDYSISVLASNSFGTGSMSDIKTVRTLEDVPNVAPSNIRFELLDDGGRVLVQWDPVSPADANGIIRGYEITYYCDPGNDETVVTISGANQTNKELYLTPGHACFLSIRAYNDAGEGKVLTVDYTAPSPNPSLSKMPSSESSVGDKKMQASANEPFTKSTYFIIIIVAVAVTLVVLVFMVTICVVHKKRTGEMDLGKVGVRPDPTGARTSSTYEMEDMAFSGGINMTTSSSSCRTPRGYFPAPPSRPAPTPSLAMSVSLQRSIGGSTPVTTELYLEKGSANQLDYEYAAEGPHLEDRAPPIPSHRPAVRPGYPASSGDLPDYMRAYAADGHGDDSIIGFDPNDRKRSSTRSYDFEYGKGGEKGRTVSFQAKERGIPSKMNNSALASRNLDVQLMGRQSQL